MASCLKDIERDLQKEATLGAAITTGAKMVGGAAKRMFSGAGKMVNSAINGTGKAAAKFGGKISNGAGKGTILNSIGSRISRGGVGAMRYAQSGGVNATAGNIGKSISGGLGKIKAAYKAPSPVTV